MKFAQKPCTSGVRRYMAEILPIQRKTQSNQSICRDTVA